MTDSQMMMMMMMMMTMMLVSQQAQYVLCDVHGHTKIRRLMSSATHSEPIDY